MKKLFLVLISVMVILSTQSFSCKKDIVPVVSKTIIEITVKDANSWSTSNTSFSLSTGATIFLYATQADITINTPKYTSIIDQSGLVKIPVVFQVGYFLIVKKGKASNLYNGYLIKGIFQSQASIQSSAFQNPAGTVGGLQFEDVNGDGIINTSDKVTGSYVTAIENQQVSVTALIY